MVRNVLRALVVVLALGGVFDSGLALRVHYMDPGLAPPCAVTELFDCGTVNHSRYAVFPPRLVDEDPASRKLHIPVAAIGIAGYALIAIVALTGRWWILLQLAEIAFGAACFLTYLEAFVLQKWCIYCLWSQGLSAAILLLTIVALLLRPRPVPVLTAEA